MLKGPSRSELKITCVPSADHTGSSSAEVSNVNREGSPRARSINQISLLPPSRRWTAAFLSSAERTTSLYSPGGPATAKGLPAQSTQTSCRLEAEPLQKTITPFGDTEKLE